MAYVAPNWKNGAAPALDAASLQAISDAIVANQTKNTQQDSSISSLQSAVSSLQTNGVKIATGNYVGTGNFGSSYPNRITTISGLKVIFIVEDNDYKTAKGGYAWIKGSRYGKVWDYTSTSAYADGCTLTWGDNYIKFYNQANGVSSSEAPSYQLNSSGKTYRWVAFG